MVTIDLRDPDVIENTKYISTLRGLGFTDEEIQMYYNNTINKERRKTNGSED